MTFDPNTHKFGMAYKLLIKERAIVYPTLAGKGYNGYGYDDIVGYCKPNNKSPSSCHVKFLVRAPEHDYVPFALVDKLYVPVAVAEKLYEALKFCKPFIEDGRVGDKRHRYDKQADLTLEALTEYEAYKNVSRGDL